MAIAPLWVSIRTTGAAALGRLSAAFLRLRATMRVAFSGAWMRFITGGGIPGAISRLAARIRGLGRSLRGLPGSIRRLGASFRALAGSIGRATRALIMYALASRLAQAVSDRLGKGLASMASTMALLGLKAAAAFALLVPLTGIVGNLLGAVQLVAPAIAAAGLVAVGLKLAFNGISDALQAGLSGDVEEFNKALAKLPKSAADTVRVLVKLRDAWKPIQQDFQSRVFEGAAGELASLSGFIKPIAATWLPRLAARFAEVRHEIADGIARYAADGRLEAVWRNVHAAVSALLGAVRPLAQAFGDVLEVAAPRFAALSDSAGSLAEKFAAWIRQAKESGKLAEWLDKAISTMDKLKTIAGNIIGIFQAMFQAGEDDGQGLLDRLIAITEATERWLKSANGQTFLELFAMIGSGFAAIAPLFEVWIGYIRAVGVAWDFLKGLVSAFWDGLKAIFAAAVGSILGSLYMILVGAEKAFGWIPGIGGKLKAAKAAFEDYARGVNAALDGIQDETVNITFHARKVGDFMMSGSQLGGSYSSGIGGRAGGGPMRAGVTYRINEQGQEFIQLGSSGRAYSARDSAAMAGGGGTLSFAGTPTGFDAIAFRWLNHAVRTGKLKLA